MEKGCEFLSKVVGKEIFTPEDLNEEQKMLKDTVDKFMKEEVLPKVDELEKGKHNLMVELLKKAGELGFFAIEYPKEYGGLELDKVSALCVNESMMQYTSFAVSSEAHVTIGSHPIIFFGTDEQKKKYLPDLAYAKKIAAYALTEPGAGSDALNAKTTATPVDGGKYFILNGTKQFITNAGFADIFIVFAKVNGKDFTAFIVERQWGVKTGKEEEKMGQKGSSTRQVILEDIKVPKENVLGEIGKGHKVALNALNLGRMRLGGVSGGAGLYLTKKALDYARERKQFGKAIFDFPLIKWKIANMATKSFAAQSAAYRLTHNIDRLWLGDGMQEWQAFEELAVEATILKVGGSELLWHIVDDAVQIHGGYGYIKEYEVERHYRDERVNRIYEGTNEINRLNIPEMIIRRAMRGRINFFEWVEKAKKEIDDVNEIKKLVQDFSLKEELFALECAKRLLIISAQEAFAKFGEEIQNEQELLAAFSDIAIGIYFSESAIARAEKHKDKPFGDYHKKMAQFFVQLYWNKIVQSFELMYMRLGKGLEIPEKLYKILPRVDLVKLSREIADETAQRM
jgi:alkylation response protein AidB-like acyl-CoA dehydrogenase